ncbi:uncharacterized protein XM38_008690 [Halomicronema hongdechloris C2206]|uniref:DUF1517 domain-containing protein n=1 Tax=Halomicronema hongdechloris C2206 TaxID=1641165 RepID=A0A1Z3HHZ3_9CYAN|nr:DUF1517 domain-containing protein [Halomicronema hongdechloris]ASC69939.1 uncharacterized protein XM38_008690 [Halomicronema hongdechloris C2206]
MVRQLLRCFQPLFKSLMVIGLILTLVLTQADSALAARGGGRIGGGGFRMPSRPYAPPSRSYRGPSGGGYGGGFGFPFIFPFFGIGGGFGGLFSLLIFIAIANFLVRSFRSFRNEDSFGGSDNPPVAVAKLQVGLLAKARSLQDDLNRMAATANTGSAVGLTQVLQEASLALLRHPDYWAYAAVESTQTPLLKAEAEFNRLTLAERSKVSEETLSNVNSQFKQATAPTATADGANYAPGEYIVATLLVAAQGRLSLPTVRNAEDLRQALSQIGAISSDRLLAVEVLWTPQQTGETLTGDEVLAAYPNLTLV